MVTGNVSQPVNGAINATKKSLINNQIKALSANSFESFLSGSIKDNASVMNMSGNRDNIRADINPADKITVSRDDSGNTRNKSKVEAIVSNEAKANDVSNAETINKAMDDVKEVVKEVLGLTDEELEQLLAENGLTLMDLLVPKNLADFVANIVTEGDTLKLITDSDACNLYTKLSNEIADIMADVSEALDINFEDVPVVMKEFESIALTAKDNIDDSDAFTEEFTVADKKYTTTDTSKEHRLVSRNEADTENATGKTEELPEVTIQTDKQSKSGSGNSEESLAQQFVDNLTESVSNVVNGEDSFSGYTVDAADIVRQLVDSVRLNVTEQTQSMEITLNPESLGKVNLLVTAKDGVLTAQLTTTNEEVKAIIENQLVSLKESFQASGLKVDAVEVAIASHGFEMGRNLEGRDDGESQGSRKRRSLSIDEINARLDGEPEISDEELLAVEMMRANGGNVDYLA